MTKTINLYESLKRRQEKELNSLPLMFAFSNSQFIAALEKNGLTMADTNKIIDIGGGGFILKSEYPAMIQLLEKMEAEKAEQIKNNDQYIYDMFFYELSNHEYCITYDLEPTIDALGLSEDDIIADDRLLTGLAKAKKDYLKMAADWI